MRSGNCMKSTSRARSPPPTAHNYKQHITAEIRRLTGEEDAALWG